MCVCARARAFSNSADSLDEDKSGLVSMEEFCRLFEPTIVRRASSSTSATMDIDDLMKETFNGILVDAKLERSVVIQVPSTAPLSTWNLARACVVRIAYLRHRAEPEWFASPKCSRWGDPIKSTCCEHLCLKVQHSFECGDTEC